MRTLEKFTHAPGSPEWVESRRAGLGGSDIAAIMGESKWRSPVQVWLEKTGKTPVSQESTFRMRRGSHEEAFIADEYRDKHSASVMRLNRRAVDGCLFAHIDRLARFDDKPIYDNKGNITDGATLLEIKTAGKKWEEIPAHYLIQVWHYLYMLPECAGAVIPVMFDFADGIEEYAVARNESTQNSIAEYAREWWDKHVVHGDEPKPMSEDDLIALCHYKPRPAVVSVSEKIAIDLGAMHLLDAQIKDLKKEYDELRDKTVPQFGGTGDIMHNGTKLATYNRPKDTVRIDYESAAKKKAGITDFTEFTTTTKNAPRLILK